VYAQGDSVLIETLQTRTYIVTGTDANGCVDKDTITITVRDMEDIFIPSLFSPNQDGANANETFKVHGKGIAEIKLQVFDRAGNLVYETTDLAQATKIGWDGKKNGIDQPSSMYIWQIAGKFRNGKILQYKGKTKGKVNLFR
jgi:gliding motility-associated-like protein